ncbi:alanine/glycine:cation symporter family protein [Biformimicrobium ophioploci]|uniref:Sodium:alanine symporter family protein n=1 Tax=Biformimicrobium ophioploci TaxID=3036711 RepID=A0ABQ6M0T2_9GAMM|nr:amino acid carrier protein [Microbulbifer sp. NKW57]GMG87969.1 sodium:alanine symporter family protein [Microbulbifer sp. NKW57]
MEFFHRIEAALAAFASFVWGTPLLVLLVGGGLYLLLYSRLKPYRHMGHAVAILRGRYDDQRDPGQISHSRALSTALSGTLGLGNISGVAIAIAVGGPGAIFWMWITAIVGVATKFYTASLAVMFRGKDSAGELQGGPMYVIREGLGKRWMPLAVLFCVAGLCGNLPVFQANQTVQLLRESFAVPMGLVGEGGSLGFDFIVGCLIAAATAIVIIGRIQRISALAIRLVPGMVLFYLGIAVYVIATHFEQVPAAFALIFTDAFTGAAVAGGALGHVIKTGVSRGAFSNEAGIGTESMAHGAAKTREPIREGVVAMIGPVVDTLIVCTCTALLIILTGVWQGGAEVQGITMTATAFEQVFPGVGRWLLLFMVVPLAFTTIVANWYYSGKCLSFLAGAHTQKYYTPVYIALVVIGAVASMDAVNNIIIGMYAIMAIPTMVSTLMLAPKVNAAAHDYFTAQAHESQPEASKTA